MVSPLVISVPKLCGHLFIVKYIFLSPMSFVRFLPRAFQLLLLLLSFPGYAEFSKTHYPLSAEPIDVVIPCSPKDLDTLELCIQGIRKNGQNIRRIIVISKERLTDSAEWIDEAIYPFSKRALIVEAFHGDEQLADAFLANPINRAGWIFQQFLKLYAPFVIPHISSNVLVLDADVIFLNPTTFMNKQGDPFFNTSHAYHPPYFNHMGALLPGLYKVLPIQSGICHYMLFQRPILEDLFAKIRAYHNIEPWKAFCRCIDQNEIFSSCLSEYEIYFSFTLLNTDQAQLRDLRWAELRTWAGMIQHQLQRYSYIVCHDWERLPSLKKDIR